MRTTGEYQSTDRCSNPSKSCPRPWKTLCVSGWSDEKKSAADWERDWYKLRVSRRNYRQRGIHHVERFDKMEKRTLSSSTRPRAAQLVGMALDGCRNLPLRPVSGKQSGTSMAFYVGFYVAFCVALCGARRCQVCLPFN